MCMACNNRICQKCGWRYGHHHAFDDGCPAPGYDDSSAKTRKWLKDQFFESKPKKEKGRTHEKGQGKC